MSAYKGNIRQFKLELSWFSREDFHDRVVEIWNKPVFGKKFSTTMEKKDECLTPTPLRMGISFRWNLQTTKIISAEYNQ
jgi:hypothetical protein